MQESVPVPGLGIVLLIGAFAGRASPETNPRKPSSGFALTPTLPTIRDKTLVVWCTLADRSQRGGSAFTLENRDRFDAIVFGERKPSAWMAGSDTFRRTQADQTGTPQERADPKTLLRIAVVYRNDSVTLWRNDAILASYPMPNPPQAFGDGSAVLIGLRHEARRGQPDSHFAGEIEEARIYDRALSADQGSIARRRRAG